MVRIFGPDLTLTRVSGLLAKEEAAKLERTLVEQLVDSNKRSINSIKPGGLGGVIIKWDESALIAETEGYTRISDFRRDKPHVYAMFHRKGLLEKLREIMPGSDFPNGYWTFGRCRDEASRFKTRADFKFSSPKAYDAACRNGWLKDITSHMPVRSCHKRSNLFDPIRK